MVVIRRFTIGTVVELYNRNSSDTNKRIYNRNSSGTN